MGGVWCHGAYSSCYFTQDLRGLKQVKLQNIIDQVFLKKSQKDLTFGFYNLACPDHADVSPTILNKQLVRYYELSNR